MVIGSCTYQWINHSLIHFTCTYIGTVVGEYNYSSRKWNSSERFEASISYGSKLTVDSEEVTDDL